MAKLPERKNVKEQYKWNLNHLVNGDSEWESKFEAIKSKLPTVAKYKGKLNERDTLLEYLKISDEFIVEILKLYLYAAMNSHIDTRINKYQEMNAKIEMLIVQLSTMVSFAEPEICQRSEEELFELSKDSDFSDYSYMLEKLAKNKKHILSEKEEKILAETGSFSANFKDAFEMYNDADIIFNKVKVGEKEVEMSHGMYGVLLQNPDKNVRKSAFESMFIAFKEHINTIAAIYAGSVKKDWFYSKVRGYGSSLECALSATNVDVRAYNNLIKAVNNNCKNMHQYMAFRKKALGLDTLNMYDLHTSLVEGVNIAVPYEKAFDMVITALQPMGEEYVSLLKHAYDNQWIDVMESKGKRSGAYSWGTYGCHPYVLLNYQKTTNNVFTIAHELGHALHSYYSNNAQPYAKCEYEIFVAEIASTVNEVMLLKYLLKTTTDLKTKKFLLSYYLDMFRTTLFRQTMFAEFELEAHKLAENDQPITATTLSDIYYDLNKKYYGKAVKHDDLIRYEWARIPHFYRAFYVYQYATGITAAVSIASDILENGEKAFRGYKKFLSAGGSMPPVEILKLANVDLTTEQPFNIAMKEFKNTLAELKEISEQ